MSASSPGGRRKLRTHRPGGAGWLFCLLSLAACGDDEKISITVKTGEDDPPSGSSTPRNRGGASSNDDDTPIGSDTATPSTGGSLPATGTGGLSSKGDSSATGGKGTGGKATGGAPTGGSTSTTTGGSDGDGDGGSATGGAPLGGSGGGGSGGASAGTAGGSSGGAGGASGGSGGGGSGGGGSGGVPAEAGAKATGECRECELMWCPDQVTGCEAAEGNAAGGPAPPGTKKLDLCLDVMQCARTWDCALAVGPEVCFCGEGVDLAACYQGQAQGPCKSEFEAAAESTMADQVSARFTDTSYAVGAAVALLWCEQYSCKDVCP